MTSDSDVQVTTLNDNTAGKQSQSVDTATIDFEDSGVAPQAAATGDSIARKTILLDGYGEHGPVAGCIINVETDSATAAALSVANDSGVQVGTSGGRREGRTQVDLSMTPPGEVAAPPEGISSENSSANPVDEDHAVSLLTNTLFWGRGHFHDGELAASEANNSAVDGKRSR